VSVVVVRSYYDTTWYCGVLRGMTEGCGNIKCIKELLVPNACRTVFLGIERKPLERGLVYCFILGMFLESVQICSITNRKIYE
jgi:hypothetical protein